MTNQDNGCFVILAFPILLVMGVIRAAGWILEKVFNLDTQREV